MSCNKMDNRDKKILQRRIFYHFKDNDYPTDAEFMALLKDINETQMLTLFEILKLFTLENEQNRSQNPIQIFLNEIVELEIFNKILTKEYNFDNLNTQENE